MLTSTATALGCSAIALATCSRFIPKLMPSRVSTSGLTYTGTAPHSTKAFSTLRWTLRGRMISSPRLQAVSTMLCTELVVPPTIKKACAAPKASAASSSASRMTDTGWQRLSSGFMLLTSTPTHCCPKKAVSSGLPRPRLCPGTSKGTTRIWRNVSSASCMGARRWSRRLRPVPAFIVLTSLPVPLHKQKTQALHKLCRLALLCLFCGRTRHPRFLPEAAACVIQKG